MFLTWVQEKKSIPEMLVLRLDLTQAPLASLYRPWGFSVCGLLPKPFCYKPLSCQPRIQKAEKLLHMTCHVQRETRGSFASLSDQSWILSSASYSAGYVAGYRKGKSALRSQNNCCAGCQKLRCELAAGLVTAQTACSPASAKYPEPLLASGTQLVSRPSGPNTDRQSAQRSATPNHSTMLGRYS